MWYLSAALPCSNLWIIFCIALSRAQSGVGVSSVLIPVQRNLLCKHNKFQIKRRTLMQLYKMAFK